MPPSAANKTALPRVEALASSKRGPPMMFLVRTSYSSDKFTTWPRLQPLHHRAGPGVRAAAGARKGGLRGWRAGSGAGSGGALVVVALGIAGWGVRCHTLIVAAPLGSRVLPSSRALSLSSGVELLEQSSRNGGKQWRNRGLNLPVGPHRHSNADVN